METTVKTCAAMSCGVEAEFEIVHTTPGADPYDGSYACVDHVGHLLGGYVNGPDAVRWDVQLL